MYLELGVSTWMQRDGKDGMIGYFDFAVRTKTDEACLPQANKLEHLPYLYNQLDFTLSRRILCASSKTK